MAKDLENIMISNNIYILTDITNETTNGLLINLTQWVDKLPFKNTLTLPQKPDEKDITDDTFYVIGKNNSYKANTPYKAIPENIPVLNVRLVFHSICSFWCRLFVWSGCCFVH